MRPQPYHEPVIRTTFGHDKPSGRGLVTLVAGEQRFGKEMNHAKVAVRSWWGDLEPGALVRSSVSDPRRYSSSHHSLIHNISCGALNDRRSAPFCELISNYASTAICPQCSAAVRQQGCHCELISAPLCTRIALGTGFDRQGVAQNP